MRSFLALALITSSLCTNLYALNQPSHLKDNLQHYLDNARKTNKVSAMQLTIIMPDKSMITISSGETQKKQGTPVNQNTLFQIGSDTKSFTAALLLKLQEEGKIKMTDTVGQYLPEYPQWKDVTISQLLRHTSGIFNYTEDKTFEKAIYDKPSYQLTPQELLTIAAKHPDYFKAGNGWHYSNTNYIIAGIIAEKVTLTHLSNLYDQFFLANRELNLHDTYYLPFPYSSAIMQRIAHGYDDKNVDITRFNTSWAGAAGAMVATSTDLAKWAYSLFHSIAISEDSLKQMMELASTTTGKSTSASTDGYGMGIGMRSSKKYGIWWGHEGETLGYHAIFLWYPSQRITIAMIANGPAPKLKEAAERLPEMIADNKTGV